MHGRLVDREGAGFTPQTGGSQRTGFGEIRLFGGDDATADYIEMPDNLLSGLTDATFEFWGTRQSSLTWSRLFDFGPNSSEYFMTTWNRENFAEQGAIEWKDQAATSVFNSTNFGIVNGTESHFAFVIDEGGGTSGQTRVSMYRNAVLVGTLDTPNTLSQINPGGNWLGRSKFAADSVANAAYNEFRVYNRALTSVEVTASRLGGPNANLHSRVQATIAGDLNGDGREELVFGGTGITVRAEEATVG